MMVLLTNKLDISQQENRRHGVIDWKQTWWLLQFPHAHVLVF